MIKPGKQNKALQVVWDGKPTAIREG